jgi:hypothetical protein
LLFGEYSNDSYKAFSYRTLEGPAIYSWQDAKSIEERNYVRKYLQKYLPGYDSILVDVSW